MDKIKQYLKGITKKKENFLNKIKTKVNEEQYFNRLVGQVLEEEEEQEREKSEKEILKKRRMFLRQKRKEFDEKYQSKSQNNL